MSEKKSLKWLSDYDNSKNLADEILADIHERTRIARSGGSNARISAEIRKKLNQMEQNIGNMDAELQKMFKNPGKYKITDKECTRRQDMLTNLAKRREYLTGMMRPGAQPQSQDRNNLFNGSGGGGNGPYRHQDTDQTMGKENDEILTLQRQVIKQQDSHLDDLSVAVSQTKEVGFAISEELDLHKRLLDELDQDVDHTSSGLKRETRNVLRLLKKEKKGCMMGCTCILVVVLILLIYLIVKHKI